MVLCNTWYYKFIIINTWGISGERESVAAPFCRIVENGIDGVPFLSVGGHLWRRWVRQKEVDVVIERIFGLSLYR